MSVRTIKRADGKTFRLGRKRPLARLPILKFRDFVRKGAAAPTPPAVCDYSAKAAAVLANIYGNDMLGDCVIAAVEHTEGVMTGNAGANPLSFTDQQTIAFYSAACGYNPADPNSDQGCDIQTVLAYWENNGSPAGSNHKIAGYMAVDPTNDLELRQAVWLFENLIFGMELPEPWINPIPTQSGFTWDVAGQIGPNNGHCFPAFGYDPSRFLISTWGMTGFITNAAVAKYGAASQYGEVYVAVSQDSINAASSLSPSGLDWPSLLSAFQALGGAPVTPPTPVPVPPSPPVPTPPVPATDAPGSAPWLAEHLSPARYMELLQSMIAEVPGVFGSCKRP